MKLELYVDITNRRLVKSDLSATPYSLPSLYRDDSLSLTFHFLTATEQLAKPFNVVTVQNLDLKVAIGVPAIVSTVLTMQVNWAKDTATNTFTGSLPLNTPEIEDAFLASNGAALSKVFEIEVQENGLPTTVLHIPVTIREDVIKAGTLPPEAYEPPSALVANLAQILEDSPTIDVVQAGNTIHFDLLPHAPTHAQGGSDPVTPISIDAADRTHGHYNATQTTDGYLSAADKTKLDGLMNSAGEANTASNIGTGEGEIFHQKTGVDLELRTIKAGAGVSISTTGNEIIVSGTSGGPSMTVTNIGAGNGIYSGTNPSTLAVELKRILPGGGISISDSGQDLTITASVEGGAQVGAGYTTFGGLLNGLLQFKSIAPGSGISIADDGTSLTLTSNILGAENQGGGYEVFAGNSNGLLQFKRLAPGGGISVQDDGATLTLITSVQGAENIGIGYEVFAGQPANLLQFKRLLAGTGFNITDDGQTLTIGFGTVIGNNLTELECKTLRAYPQATATSGTIDLTLGSLQTTDASSGAAFYFQLAGHTDGKMTTLLVRNGTDNVLDYDPSWIFFGDKPTVLPAGKHLLIHVTCMDVGGVIASAILST